MNSENKTTNDSQINTINFTVITGDGNQVNQQLGILDPGAELDSRTSRVKVIWKAFFKGLIWMIQNPEWLLKWAATILLLKLFFSEGFTVQTFQKLNGV